MSQHFRFGSFLGIAVLLAAAPLQAETIEDGQAKAEEIIAGTGGQGHYCYGVEALNAGDWREALRQFEILAANYPCTSYGLEANFFVGVCHYFLKEFECANDSFTAYLKCQSNPRYFFETIEYKFAIAEQFRCGAKRRCFGYKMLPKWASGRDIALQIYDEISVVMPHHDIAAQALYSKACLLWREQDYRDSVDTFKMLIRRFPKNDLAPESYLLISRLYLEQSKVEFQNPDIIDFAQINLRKFELDFPNDERIAEAEADVCAIKEVYARGLFHTGDFYERTWRPQAAAIYYRKAMRDFPGTITAGWCQRRLNTLGLCETAEENSEACEGIEDINLLKDDTQEQDNEK